MRDAFVIQVSYMLRRSTITEPTPSGVHTNPEFTNLPNQSNNHKVERIPNG